MNSPGAVFRALISARHEFLGKKNREKGTDFSLVQAGVQLSWYSGVYSHEVKLSHRHWGWQLIKLVTLGQAGQGVLQRAQVLLMQGSRCQLENEIPFHAQECDFEAIFLPEFRQNVISDFFSWEDIFRAGGKSFRGAQRGFSAQRVTAQPVPINFVFSLKAEMGLGECLWFSHPFSQRKIIIFHQS